MTTHTTRILVVDDDLRLRDLLTRYLAEQGFEVAPSPTRATSTSSCSAIRRPGRARPHAARRGRARHLPAAARRRRERADHHAHRQGRRRRPHRRASRWAPTTTCPSRSTRASWWRASTRCCAARRARGARRADREAGRVPFGPFMLDLATRTLTRDGEPIDAHHRRVRAAQGASSQHPRQPLSRDKLMELARGREHEVFDRSIDVQVSRLRKLVEQDPAAPALHPDRLGLRLRVRARRRARGRIVLQREAEALTMPAATGAAARPRPAAPSGARA